MVHVTPILSNTDSKSSGNPSCAISFRPLSLHYLYVAYNNAFRMMHHLPTYCSASEMFTVNRVPNCAAVIMKLTFRFMSRLSLSNNALVCSIIDSDLMFQSRIRPHWMNMLYVHFSGG